MGQALDILSKRPQAAKRPDDDDLSLDASPPKLPRCTEKCPFFALPQKLRDRIYREAFDEDPEKPPVYILQALSFRVFVIPHDYPISILTRWHGWNVPLVRDLPAWLPVSRRFLAETLDAFSLGRMFEMEDSFLVNRPLFDINRHRPCHDDWELENQSDYPLYKDFIDRTLIKSIRTVGVSVYGVTSPPAVRRLSPADQDALSALLAHRDLQGPRLDFHVLWHFEIYDKT